MININLEAENNDIIAYIDSFGHATTTGAYKDITSFKAKKGPYKDCWHVIKWNIKHPWDDGEKVCTVIFDNKGLEKKIINHI